MWNYKGIDYVKAVVNGHEGFISNSNTVKWNVLYPLSTHQDVRNTIDHQLHYQQIDDMNIQHDKEIDRIFSKNT